MATPRRCWGVSSVRKRLRANLSRFVGLRRHEVMSVQPGHAWTCNRPGIPAFSAGDFYAMILPRKLLQDSFLTSAWLPVALFLTFFSPEIIWEQTGLSPFHSLPLQEQGQGQVEAPVQCFTTTCQRKRTRTEHPADLVKPHGPPDCTRP